MISPNAQSGGVLNLDTALGGDATGWGDWFLTWQETVRYDGEHGAEGVEGPFGSIAVSAAMMAVEQDKVGKLAFAPVKVSEAAIIAAGIRAAEAAIKAGTAMPVSESPSFQLPKYQSPLVAARV